MILELLKEKKHFLQEFNKINSKEIVNFQNNNYNNIDIFYNSRESLLEILKYIDQKIENISLLTPMRQSRTQLNHEKYTIIEVNSNEKLIVFLKLEIKSISQEILNQNMEILSMIDQEKSSIIKELQNINKNKKNFGSYKTKINHHQIDEEA